jgi:hypothetical protein
MPAQIGPEDIWKATALNYHVEWVDGPDTRPAHDLRSPDTHTSRREPQNNRPIPREFLASAVNIDHRMGCVYWNPAFHGSSPSGTNTRARPDVCSLTRSKQLWRWLQPRPIDIAHGQNALDQAPAELLKPQPSKAWQVQLCVGSCDRSQRWSVALRSEDPVHAECGRPLTVSLSGLSL